jgi:hypothetical protein
MMEGISNEVLKRYIETREKIDDQINAIAVFTSLLSYYKECTSDLTQVDLYTFGYVNEMLNEKVMDIMDELDEFLPLWDAKAAVQGEETELQ